MMKQLLYRISVVVLALALGASCSNDDDGSGNGGKGDGIPWPVKQGDFLPSNNGNNWIYVIATETNDGAGLNFLDSLYVKDEVKPLENFILDVNEDYNNEDGTSKEIYGTVNRFLAGDCSKTPTSLSVKGGSLTVGLFEGIEVPATETLKMIDLTKKSGKILSIYENEFDQEISGFNVTVKYKYTTEQLEVQEQALVNGKEEKNVASSALNLELQVSTLVPVNGAVIPMDIIKKQNVMRVINYYVDGVGLVRSENDTSFEISPEFLAVLDELGVDIEGIEQNYFLFEVVELLGAQIAD